MIDKKLWKAFSEYIRLRDADNNGNCKCITCGLIRHWRKMDCGHGIGRQHWSTRYSEENNHAQCKRCNGFEGGRMDIYAVEVDKMHGKGTWEMLNLLSKKVIKRYSAFECSVLEKHFKEQAERIRKFKKII